MHIKLPKYLFFTYDSSFLFIIPLSSVLSLKTADLYRHDSPLTYVVKIKSNLHSPLCSSEKNHGQEL